MSDTRFYIREATPDDAEAIIGHVHRIAGEPGIRIPMKPGEFKITVEEERRILAEYASSENSLYLLAESDAEVVGVLNCNGWKRRAMWHVVTLGMTIREEWRGQGVGPPGRRVGRRLRYRPEDVKAWVAGLSTDVVS